VAEDELDPAERLAMARRYLGAAGGDRYVAGNPDPARENVAFRMRPERCRWLELAGLQDYRDGGAGTSYWEAAQLLTVYTFKRPVPE
jgi:hypothetical protein